MNTCRALCSAVWARLFALGRAGFAEVRAAAKSHAGRMLISGALVVIGVYLMPWPALVLAWVAVARILLVPRLWPGLVGNAQALSIFDDIMATCAQVLVLCAHDWGEMPRPAYPTPRVPIPPMTMALGPFQCINPPPAHWRVPLYEPELAQPMGGLSAGVAIRSPSRGMPLLLGPRVALVALGRVLPAVIDADLSPGRCQWVARAVVAALGYGLPLGILGMILAARHWPLVASTLILGDLLVGWMRDGWRSGRLVIHVLALGLTLFL